VAWMGAIWRARLVPLSGRRLSPPLGLRFASYVRSAQGDLASLGVGRAYLIRRYNALTARRPMAFCLWVLCVAVRWGDPRW
jgi:hypothetical protein